MVKHRIYNRDGKWHVKALNRNPHEVINWKSMLAAFNLCIFLNGEENGKNDL